MLIAICKYYRFMYELSQEGIHMDLLKCPLCNRLFKKAITLSCGHSFCRACLEDSLKLRRQNENRQRQEIDVPQCPSCKLIIWRPMNAFRQNIVINQLVSKQINSRTGKHEQNGAEIDEKTVNESQNAPISVPTILIDVEASIPYPLPCALTTISFKTEFLAELLEQQTQGHPLAIVCSQFQEQRRGRGLLCRIGSVRQIYEGRGGRAFQAVMQGISYCTITGRRKLQMPVSQDKQSEVTSILQLCRYAPFPTFNPQPISAFAPFFNLYDQLSNPHYLNQLAHLVPPDILFNRNDSSKVVYSILRVLRMREEDRRAIVELDDQQLRAEAINRWIQDRQGSMIQDIIEIKVPGAFSNGVVVALILFILMLSWTMGY